VAQARRVCAVDVRALLQGVYLMHAYAFEALVVRLQHVQQRDRFAVGHRNDHVGAERHGASTPSGALTSAIARLAHAAPERCDGWIGAV